MASSSVFPNIFWVRGDSKSWTITVKDDGTPIDLTAFSFVAELRKKSSHDTAWPFTIDETNKATGVLVLTAPTAAGTPGVGVWDLRQYAGTSVTTLVQGDVAVYDNVSEIP